MRLALVSTALGLVGPARAQDFVSTAFPVFLSCPLADMHSLSIAFPHLGSGGRTRAPDPRRMPPSHLSSEQNPLTSEAGRCPTAPGRAPPSQAASWACTATTTTGPASTTCGHVGSGSPRASLLSRGRGGGGVWAR